MSQTVVGIFDSSTEAQNAVQRLGENGFTIDQVDLTYNTTSVLEDQNDTETVHRNQSSGLGERVNNFFKSLFDDDESDRYSRAARNAAIVTVIADSSDRALSAAQIMDDCGAIDVDERSRDYENTNSATGSITSDNYDQDTSSSGEIDINRDSKDSGSIPIVEEELRVGKREVDRGTVRVRSRIVERPVEEHVRLREERVTVERNAVNRPATEGDLNTLREGEIELKQRAEVPVVSKETRVVEEVRLNRDVVERDETIRDTVRKTEVDIDEDVTDDVRATDRDLRKQNDDLLD